MMAFIMRIICSMGFHDWEAAEVCVGPFGDAKLVCRRCGKCAYETGDYKRMTEEALYRRRKRRSKRGRK